MSVSRAVTALAVVVLATAATARAQVINEFVANHTGTDTYEFVEVLGTPATDYSSLRVVQIEGDTADGPGRLDSAIAVGTTDADGRWVSAFFTNELHNDHMTLLLVDGFSGTVGTDLDTNDDGVLDVTPWTAVLDEIAVEDDTEPGFVYAAVVLLPGSDGVVFTWGGASRIPDGTDTDDPSDWLRNDFSGCGLPGLGGFLDPGEACNTPGEENRITPDPKVDPWLNEIIADHAGTPDDHEFVEVGGTALADYSTTCAAVVVGDAGAAGVVDAAFQVGSMDGSGYWTTGFLTAELEDGSYTVVLAEWPSCAGAAGSDLDGDDDGTLDAPPWTELYDAVAVSDGDPGDRLYAAAVVTPGWDGQAGTPGGIARIPDGADTDAASDWWRTDFAGAGLGGAFPTVPATGSALNTPGWINRLGVVDTYAGVDPSTPQTLRATLHEAVDDHRRFDYTSVATDTWDVLEDADELPADPTRVLTVYRNADHAKFGGGVGPYNREHSWAKSYGFPDLVPDNSPYTDCHHLFLSDGDYNFNRSNHPFRSCDATCTEFATDVNNGTGGSPGAGYPGLSNWDGAADYTQGTWEVWVGRRGDVARALFYMDVRYEGGVHGVTGHAEPDLRLTDDEALIDASNTGVNEPVAYMGMLSTLLAWHVEDPVDDLERRRNERVAAYQGNRNPFVDHPEWVEAIFVDVFSDGFESGDVTAWSAAAGAP